MIVTRIDGGLGNQMFQYAFGLYLAKKHQTELALDLSSYRTGPQHGYMLDRFRIAAEPLSDSSAGRIPRRYRVEKAAADGFTFSDRLPDWLCPSVLRRVKERPFGFNEKYLRTSDNSYLVGYWQSEKFFPGLRAALLEQFVPASNLSSASQRVIERMRSTASISLHIRRGDYVTNPATSGIYEQLSLEYYRNCLDRFAMQHHDVEVFVFSNDLAWCQQHLQLPFPTHFVDHVAPRDAFEDLLMMSQAKGNVIANSTFSWWAAYLNDRSDRVTFAPDRWFRPGTLDGRHLPCPGWHLVEGTQESFQKAA